MIRVTLRDRTERVFLTRREALELLGSRDAIAALVQVRLLEPHYRQLSPKRGYVAPPDWDPHEVKLHLPRRARALLAVEPGQPQVRVIGF